MSNSVQEPGVSPSSTVWGKGTTQVTIAAESGLQDTSGRIEGYKEGASQVKGFEVWPI